MLRENPYRICFPVGALLGAAGIAHWAAYAQGALADYRPIFHVTAQVQGFVSCFAAGFLLTMVPRRLQGASPPLVVVLGVPAAFSAAVGLAWGRQILASQVVWLAGVALLSGYILPRIAGLGARRRAPNTFIWIVMALLMGAGGATITILATTAGSRAALWHQMGQDLVLQGMPLALILGAGSLALPLMTRDEPPTDGFTTRRDGVLIVAHVGAGVLLVASFWIAVTVSLRAGLALRLLVVAAVLLVAAQMWKRPTRPGWNARLIWGAAWSTALGLALGAAWPSAQRAGLHVTFILGFALLSLAIGSQVSFGHAGRRDEVLGRPVSVVVMAALMVVAAIARAAMELQPAHYRIWMSIAAVMFLAALLVWSAWVAPTWLPRRGPSPES